MSETIKVMNMKEKHYTYFPSLRELKQVTWIPVLIDIIVTPNK